MTSMSRIDKTSPVGPRIAPSVPWALAFDPGVLGRLHERGRQLGDPVRGVVRDRRQRLPYGGPALAEWGCADRGVPGLGPLGGFLVHQPTTAQGSYF